MCSHSSTTRTMIFLDTGASRAVVHYGPTVMLSRIREMRPWSLAGCVTALLISGAHSHACVYTIQPSSYRVILQEHSLGLCFLLSLMLKREGESKAAMILVYCV